MAYDWNAYSHQSLYDMVHGKLNIMGMGDVGLSGVGGAEGAGTHAQDWSDFARRMGEFHQRLESALAASKGSWEGAAADSMHSGVTPLGQWAENAHQAGMATKTSADGYTEAFSRAKTSMPEPVKVNTTAHPAFTGIPSSFTSLVGAQQDQDPQEVRAQQAKAEAVTVMHGYESGATSSRDGMGSFPTPPEITTAVQDTSKPVTPVAPKPHTPPDAPTGSDSGQTHSTGHVSHTSGPVRHAPNPAQGNPGLVAPSQAATTTHPGPIAQQPLPAGRPPATGTPGGNWTMQPVPHPGVTGAPGTGEPNNRQAQGSGPRGAGVPDEAGARLNRGPNPGQSPGRGANTGAMPLEEAERMPGRSGIASGTRTGGPGTGGMMGGGHGGRREEDEERHSPTYLQDTHDDFWDDTPPVAPDVIE